MIRFHIECKGAFCFYFALSLLFCCPFINNVFQILEMDLLF